ncbi:GDP-L-fucose synthase [Microbulbifer thermotolerans]
MKKRIFVAGHEGMVGSAIVRKLRERENVEIITVSRDKLDLSNQSAVKNFFSNERIDIIYLAAAKVGGVYANNKYPAQFIYENLMIECNVIHQAHEFGVQHLLFLGSSCIYPRISPQPIGEDSLLQGGIEPTNEPYAIAKIAGIKLCESYARQYGRDYRSVMPSNLYGPNDNFHPQNSHVIPALIRRFHEAKLSKASQVVIWGTGTPRREFLYVDDMAEACIHIMDLDKCVYASHTHPQLSHINIGSGVDLTIRELAECIARIVGFHGRLVFDKRMPDGAPRKLLDVSLLTRLGWKSTVSLEDGLERTYKWFLDNCAMTCSH